MTDEKAMERLRDLVASLDDGKPDWSFRLWQVVKDGMRTWTKYSLPQVGPCECTDARRYATAAGGWFLSGEFVPASEWDVLYSEWVG